MTCWSLAPSAGSRDVECHLAGWEGAEVADGAEAVPAIDCWALLHVQCCLYNQDPEKGLDSFLLGVAQSETYWAAVGILTRLKLFGRKEALTLQNTAVWSIWPSWRLYGRNHNGSGLKPPLWKLLLWAVVIAVVGAVSGSSRRTWWWTPSVNKSVELKKEVFRCGCAEGSPETADRYQQSRRVTLRKPEPACWKADSGPTFYPWLLEGAQGISNPVYMCFVDLKKAYDLDSSRCLVGGAVGVWSAGSSYNRRESCVSILGSQ